MIKSQRKPNIDSELATDLFGAKPKKRVRFEDDVDITVKSSSTKSSDSKVIVTKEMSSYVQNLYKKKDHQVSTPKQSDTQKKEVSYP